MQFNLWHSPNKLLVWRRRELLPSLTSWDTAPHHLHFHRLSLRGGLPGRVSSLDLLKDETWWHLVSLGLCYKWWFASSLERGLAGASWGDHPAACPAATFCPRFLAGHRKPQLVPSSLQSIFFLPLIFIGLCLKCFVCNYTVYCMSCFIMTNTKYMYQQREARN